MQKINLFVTSLGCLLMAMACNTTSEKPTSKNNKIINASSAADSLLDKKWWKEAVVYQIYPRSFKDSDGDGVGDIKGIISKLDYVKSLGVDMWWLNPVYASPNKDNGYDISDYENIMKEFGTMADFDVMLKGFHDRNVKVFMDLVLNHCSEEQLSDDRI
jgi:oligo-1,6-glucosidase